MNHKRQWCLNSFSKKKKKPYREASRAPKVENRIVSNVEEFFLAKGPSSSAVVRGCVIHDIKEVEGAKAAGSAGRYER